MKSNTRKRRCHIIQSLRSNLYYSDNEWTYEPEKAKQFLSNVDAQEFIDDKFANYPLENFLITEFDR